MKYIIHACTDRLWYVENYIIPSMTAQGINASDIATVVDEHHLGELEMTMKSFLEQKYDAWHLQDDILISSKFKKVAESASDTIMCGYCSAYTEGKPAGLTQVANMWYSFPCIYIPRKYANEVGVWFYNKAYDRPEYQKWIEEKKYSDEFFRTFIKRTYPDIKVNNVSPNIVEHVDWLIGGSIINNEKTELRRAKYWNEPDIVNELTKQLSKDDHISRSGLAIMPEIKPKRTPRFSIIIPAYNSAKFITRALDSVASQSFTDYELIVICDNCTDNTGQIAQRYGAIVKAVNYGCDGPTRSRGIDIASGEYVLFIDDDDWLLHEFVLEQLDAQLKTYSKPVDVLCCSFIYQNKGYAEPISHFNGNKLWIAVWNKCWRRKAIGTTRFPNVPRSSDRYFHMEMMRKKLYIEKWDMPIYYYNFMREGSQTEAHARGKGCRPAISQPIQPPVITNQVEVTTARNAKLSGLATQKVEPLLPSSKLHPTIKKVNTPKQPLVTHDATTSKLNMNSFLFTQGRRNHL